MSPLARQVSTWALLAALLALPAAALLRESHRPEMAFISFAIMSLATYGVYAFDKRRAQGDGWRIPESRLHLFALLGGWPGAYVAQRLLRHKTSKRPFLIIFWIIVALHQLIALDAVLGWPVMGS
jgi:uncharacterized membrane protein YsdA (DUF1294 family)